MLLARTKESAALEEFKPDELITFEDTCPQKVEAVTGEMQNQEISASVPLDAEPTVNLKWLSGGQQHCHCSPHPPTCTHCLPSLTRRSDLFCRDVSHSLFMDAEACHGLDCL